MKTHSSCLGSAVVLGLALCAPVFGTVTITAFTPSLPSPQKIGTKITWTATATDTNAGPLTFQFNILKPHATQYVLVKDFNLGTLADDGTWTAHPFGWMPTGPEGVYGLQVVIKDFTSGESATKTVAFTMNPLAVKGPAVAPTQNPLVMVFGAPACPSGSTMRAVFQQQGPGAGPVATNWVGCTLATMNFEIAGLLANTTYLVHAQTRTGAAILNGPTISFTTQSLPLDVPFPSFTVQYPLSGQQPSDTANTVILHNMIQLGGGIYYPDVATDLAGNIIWYYYADDRTHGDVLARPMQGGGFITMQDDYAWDPQVTKEQMLRQIDLAGNIVRETNMGIIQQQLTAMGAVNGGACRTVPMPAQVGASCTGAFHHDAIQTLPNGYTAVLLDVERIFPAGTQGNTSGLPVDVIGDMIIVLDGNWQVKWYWDSFAPARGGLGYARLPVSRAAVLGETCGTSTPGCPPIFLLSSGVAPVAHDWLHANSLYYWPNSGGTAHDKGDLIWSSRHQDWIFKIDYQDGQGSGNILWRMGPGGDFTFQNVYNDPWPWFSHQHDAGIENNGTGLLTIFDNGNTRVSQPSASTGGTPGLGSACTPNDCDSRGMAMTFDEQARTVTVSPSGVSLDLGKYSPAMGSGQQLDNGNYFFENPVVVLSLSSTAGYSIEDGPTPAAPQVGPANMLLNLAGPEHYRGWQMPNLYFPPTT